MFQIAIPIFLAISVASPAIPVEPTTGIVQAAYERESERGDPRHDKNLKVLSVDCNSGKIEHEFLCWVTFTSTVDPAQPLYYDVAAVADTDTGWALKTGLCRR